MLAMRKLALAVVSIAAVFALVFGFVMGTSQTVLAGSLAKTTTLRVDTAGSNISKGTANRLYANTLPLRFGSAQGSYTYTQDDNRGILDVQVNNAATSPDSYIDKQQAGRRFLATYNISTETTNLYEDTSGGVFASFGPNGAISISTDPFNSGTTTKIDYTKVASASAIADFWLDKKTFNAIVDHYYSNTSAWTYLSAGGISATDPTFVTPSAYELEAVKKIAAITGKKDNATALTAAEYRMIAIAWPELSKSFLINSAPVPSNLLTNKTATAISLSGISNTSQLVSAINYPIYQLSPTFQTSFPSRGASQITVTGLDSKSFIILVTVVGMAIIAALLIWWYRIVGLVASVCIAAFLATLLAIMGSADINVDVTTLLAMGTCFLLLLKLVVDQAQAISAQVTAGLSTKEAFRHSIKRRLVTSVDYAVVLILAGICFALMGSNGLKDFGIAIMIGAGAMVMWALVYSTWL